MTKFVRFAPCTWLLIALSLVRPTWANSWSNDQSDLWWNASEDGWGIQFVQRGNTIFATMFVYDAAGKPTWYVATMAGTKAGNVLTFSGDLLVTHGPWFGTDPYDRTSFGYDKVGTMTWQKSSGPGTLKYSVGGVNVTKVLTRQPVGMDDYTGTYNAGLHLVDSGCTNPAKNGPIDGGDTLAITQSGATISLAFLTAGCTLAGTYAQNGQFGTVAGNYSCSSGDRGTFNLSNMNVTPYSMSALLSTSSAVDGCQGGGQVGGVRNDK